MSESLVCSTKHLVADQIHLPDRYWPDETVRASLRGSARSFCTRPSISTRSPSSNQSVAPPSTTSRLSLVSTIGDPRM